MARFKEIGPRLFKLPHPRTAEKVVVPAADELRQDAAIHDLHDRLFLFFADEVVPRKKLSADGLAAIDG